MLSKLVMYVVEKVVDKPEKISVNEVDSGDAIVVKLSVAPEDLGKIIGKEGKMARVIRTLVHTAAIVQGKRAVLEIVK
jgi:uncharacterized protein